jgi:hypothetical protein
MLEIDAFLLRSLLARIDCYRFCTVGFFSHTNTHTIIIPTQRTVHSVYIYYLLLLLCSSFQSLSRFICSAWKEHYYFHQHHNYFTNCAAATSTPGKIEPSLANNWCTVQTDNPFWLQSFNQHDTDYYVEILPGRTWRGEAPSPTKKKPSNQPTKQTNKKETHSSQQQDDNEDEEEEEDAWCLFVCLFLWLCVWFHLTTKRRDYKHPSISVFVFPLWLSWSSNKVCKQ